VLISGQAERYSRFVITRKKQENPSVSSTYMHSTTDDRAHWVIFEIINALDIIRGISKFLIFFGLGLLEVLSSFR
jgi:hypothetical protein